MKPIGILIAALAVLLLSCAGCATVKADIKSVEQSCKGTAIQDVEAVLPYVVQLAVCEAEQADCSAIFRQMEALGVSDIPGAKTCALAKIHDATVKLATTVDAGAGQ